jgi:hypothetical protein
MKKLLICLSLCFTFIQGCSTFEYERCYTLDLSKIPELQPILEITGNIIITPCMKITLNWEDISQGNFANMVKVWFADGKWNTELIKVEATETDAPQVTVSETVNPVKVDITLIPVSEQP